MVLEVTRPTDEHEHKIIIGDPPWVCETCGAPVLLFTKTFRADPTKSFYIGMSYGVLIVGLIAMILTLVLL